MSLNKKFYVRDIFHGLMFHRFHGKDSDSSGQGSILPNELEDILEFVGVKNILNPQEWLERLRNQSLKTQDVCLTLDDGLKCQYDVCLPVLEKYNLKAFWFVYSSVFQGKLVESEIYSLFATRYFDSMESFFDIFLQQCPKAVLEQLNGDAYKKFQREVRTMCPFYTDQDLKYRYVRNELLSSVEFKDLMDQMMKSKGVSAEELGKNLWLSDHDLRALISKGHVIGLHSYHHPFKLGQLSYPEQLSEYQMNYDHIHSVCGQEILSMSHPLNSYNEDTKKILSQMGIVCGFRANMTPVKGMLNPSSLEIAREDCINILKEINEVKV